MEMLATTLFGLEEVLSSELREAGASDIATHNRAVSFTGDRELLYRLNLMLRTASKLLMPVRSTRVRSERDLYSAARDIDWKKYLDPERTFAVDSVVHSKHFNHSKFVALRVKDAIADQFREKTGRRPSVDRENPDVQINVHIDRERMTISLDSSGVPLHRRGYRLEGRGAPIGEVLAAGMIRLSGWNGKDSFIDPLCGSGTIPIEAAMIAKNISPGLSRKRFGFFGWKDFDRGLFDKTVSELKKGIRPAEGVIAGTDISGRTINTAIANARRAGLENDIRFEACPFEKVVPPEAPGVAVMNPPYGKRMGQEDIIEFYKMIGDGLKNSFEGYDAWVISSNLKALKFVGLRPSKKIILFNGPLECRFHAYSVYRGSKKAKYNKPDQTEE
ncbi:MAG: class I SAM-dependent RNA methyltransferase [Candidatus Krumholzibacteria bacterium]|nr:class I SAM-dependent RNA methyltransferase [Candidatus Krumholzibacteria bacterium]